MTILRYATEEEKVAAKEQGTSAALFSEPREIVLYKKSTATTLSHEVSHLRLGHLKAKEDSPNLYVDDEIDAWLDTYNRLGRPRGLYRRLLGVVLHTLQEWDTPPRATMVMLIRKFKEPGIPTSWKQSLSKVDRLLVSKGY